MQEPIGFDGVQTLAKSLQSLGCATPLITLPHMQAGCSFGLGRLIENLLSASKSANLEFILREL